VQWVCSMKHVTVAIILASAPAHAERFELYGNLDVSLDDSTKGIAGMVANDGTSTPVGNSGWMPAVSTNISYVGARGGHAIAGIEAVFQLETQVDVSATAGTVNTNSNSDSIVRGGLTSRNSFVGLTGEFGALKIGKTDAPMKLSIARVNPFAGTVGDASAIIGNTGGDNRVEFGTRLDHALWYESPSVYGFTAVVLWSPGQNRADDNSIQAAGESGCTGGNVPGSGGLPYGCNDGSYGTAIGASIAYESGPVYAAASYELHRDVNRSSDEDGSDVMVGAQRVVFDDRFAVADAVSLGYAHAFKSPAVLGERNIETTLGADTSSNMFAGMYRRAFDSHISVYVVYALQANHRAAHYDLGAGGRAVTTDCHDATQIAAVNPDGTPNGGGPFCYTGGRLQAVSTGMTYRF
jgi:Gram-negative porin